jgi:hypothetical protein
MRTAATAALPRSCAGVPGPLLQVPGSSGNPDEPRARGLLVWMGGSGGSEQRGGGASNGTTGGGMHSAAIPAGWLMVSLPLALVLRLQAPLPLLLAGLNHNSMR